jgi:flavodoxin
MKVLIAYFSQTGNTSKVARAIYQAVLSQRPPSQGHEVALKAIGEVSARNLNDYDLVYLGSACHDTDLAKPAIRLLKDIDASPPFKLAGFVTHAAHMPQADESARELYERWAGNCIRTFQRTSEEKRIAFLGYFHCQGAPSPPIEAFIHHVIVTDKEEWATYIATVRGRPNDEDLPKAQAFARHVLDKCGC